MMKFKLHDIILTLHVLLVFIRKKCQYQLLYFLFNSLTKILNLQNHINRSIFFLSRVCHNTRSENQNL